LIVKTPKKALNISIVNMRKSTLFVFIALFTSLQVKSKAQSQNLNCPKQTALIGVWAMFNERHPDGWKTWKKPFEYLEFKEDGKFIRTYLLKKMNYAVLGTYKLSNDSLIIFHASVATDGKRTVGVPEFISRLYVIKNDELELWEDWKRILWNSTKKMGHKKRFRPLTIKEKENLELAHILIFPFDHNLKQ
jgi:hypothetical protein